MKKTSGATVLLCYRATVIALALVSLHVSQDTLQAAFLDNGWGARPAGMGNAFSAVADDSNAPLFNPAGISQVQTHEATFMHAQLFTGLDLKAGQEDTSLGLNYFSYVAPPAGRAGSFGASWANFQASHLYREDTYTLSYAKAFQFNLLDYSSVLSLGLNLKFLRSSFTLDANSASDPLFQKAGRSQSAFTPDFGLLLAPNTALPGLRFSLVGKNLSRPDLGLSQEDRLPLEIRGGIAYNDRDSFPFVTSADLVSRDGDTNVHLGIERWLFQERLGLRLGGHRRELGTGLSFYTKLGSRLTLGIDYSFTLPLQVSGTTGNHRTSLTIYF